MDSQFVIPASHPSLEGHFPGNPVVPGVVILDKILQEIDAAWPGQGVTGFSFVKFINPIRAEIKIQISIIEKDREKLKFECKHGEEIMVSGQCKIADKEGI